MKTIYITSDPTISKKQIIRIEYLVSDKVEVLNKNKMTPSETIELLKNVEILVLLASVIWIKVP